MSTHPAGTSRPSRATPETTATGPGFAISNGIVQLLRARAGRGPTQAKTSISSDLVIVTLGDCLTTFEKSLIEDGEHELVKRNRERLHHTLRAAATEIVETNTRKQVVAYLTDQQYDPDIAMLAFVLGDS
jgi:uncharacterized protein YbcI